MGSAGEVSSLDGHLHNEGVVLCGPQASIGLDSMFPTLAVGRVMGFPWGVPVSWPMTSGVVLPRFWSTSYSLKVMYPPTCCFNSTMLIAKVQ